MAAGWIKLHRKILENPVVMKDTDHLSVWIYLLLTASHVVQNSIFGGKKTKIKAGELITGRRKIQAGSRVSGSKVERILKVFESEQMIRQRTSSTSRIISILNWSDYQISEQQSEQQMDSDWTATGQPVDTVLRIKELKNDKNIPHREKLLEDKRYLETVQMNWKVNLTQLNLMMDAFIQTLIAEEKVHKDYPAFKSHFNNWGVKRFTEYLENENSQPIKISSFV